MVKYKKNILLLSLILLVSVLKAQEELSVSIDTDPTPPFICGGVTVELHAVATGGTSNYTFSWVGNNYIGDGQYAYVTPNITTVYTVNVNDGIDIAQANVTVVVAQNPEVDAGEDGITCENNPYPLSLSNPSVANQSGILWTTNGDGNFQNGQNTITEPTYVPGVEDIGNGSVVLTLNAFAIPPCTGAVSDQMVLNIASSPTADAGADIEICENENVALSGNAQNYSSVAWSSNGDGYFTDFSSLQTTYIPAGADFNTGSVMLTLTANASSPCVGSTSDNLNVTIATEPSADAGADDQVCEGSNYSLSGNVENFSALIWTTSGDGNFQNPNQTNAVYIPGNQDIQNGEVQLTLTATGNTACSDVQVSDQMTLEIFQQPQVNAGPDVNICENQEYTLNPETQFISGVQWGTSGDGTFDDNTLEAATYTPGTNDISNGEVTLIITGNAMSPCTGSVTDTIIITLDPLPSVSAGSNDSSCDNTNYQLNGIDSTNMSSGYYWQTSGNGTFIDSTSLDAEYIPGLEDAQNGSVVLTLNAQPQGTCTDEVSDSMTLTFIPGPFVEAGTDGEICETGTFMTSGTAQETTNTTWTTSGDGTFEDNTEPLTDYTPGNQDIENGSVYLILTGTNDACGESQDSLLLTIQPEPEVDAGEDAISCFDAGTGQIVVQLEGSAQNYTQLEWTSSGFGVFENDTALSTTYTFQGQDLEDQQVTLTLTAFSENPCSGSVSDDVVTGFNYNPLANAGPDEAICEGDTIFLNGTGSNYYTGVYWFRLPNATGQGEFINQNSLEAKYVPSGTDYENGEVSFRLQVQNLNCGLDYDTVSFDIQRSPSVNAGEDFAICRNGTAPLDGTVEFATGIQWNTLPGSNGTFDDATIADPVYTPGSSDINNGVARLVVSGWAALPCDTPGRDTIEVQVNDFPAVDLGNDIEACSGSSVDLVADAENFSTFSWKTSGDGSFSVQDLQTQYTIGGQDALDGQVTITFTAEPDFPCSGAVEDQLTITIKEGAVIEMNNLVMANYNESYTFEPVISSNSSNLIYLWEPQDLLLDATALDATTVPFPIDGDSTYLFELFVTNEDNGCVNADTARVYLDLGEVSINLTADPAYVCEGGSTTLYPNASGGTGTYDYFWQADPGSWTSNVANPVVSPDVRTTYTVIVSDNVTSPSADITIDIKPTPTSPSISGNAQSSQYATEVYTTTGNDLAYYEWWARNGSVIEGQGTKSATIEWGSAGSGIVYMRMASEFGCFGDTSQMDVSIGTVSLEEIAGVTGFRIYPNPAGEYVLTDFVTESKSAISYSLYDSRGVKIKQKHLGLMNAGEKSIRIDLNGQPEGIYLLRLKVGDGQLTRRFLKL